MPDDRPGIEWGVETQFGGVPVKMFVDGIFQDERDQHWIVDFKTGKNTPHSALQLALYRAGIKRTTGMEIDRGAYYMTRKGEITDRIDLTPWDEDFFDGWFGVGQSADRPRHVRTQCGHALRLVFREGLLAKQPMDFCQMNTPFK